MDIYLLQVHDHRGFLFLLKLAESISAMNKRNISLILDKLKREVLAHSIAEDIVFFKAIEERIPSLAPDVKAIRNDHKIIEDLFNKLGKNFPKNKSKILLYLKSLKKTLESDIYKEEEILIPEAKTIFSPTEAKEMAINMLARKIEFEDNAIKRAMHKMKEMAESSKDFVMNNL